MLKKSSNAIATRPEIANGSVLPGNLAILGILRAITKYSYS